MMMLVAAFFFVSASSFTMSPPVRRPLKIYAGESDTTTLTQENVELALDGARTELSALFGYLPENRQVGITGNVDLVEISGPTVIIRLTGRFWHERSTVLERVANFLQMRIPELCDVEIEDPSQLVDDDNVKQEAAF